MTDRSVGGVERAEFRMREVTAAWEVLRSPVARARYDQELNGRAGDADLPDEPVAGSMASSFSSHGGNATTTQLPPIRLRTLGAEPEEVADLAPATVEPLATKRGPRWLTWGPILIGSAVVALVLAVAVLGAINEDRAVRVQTVEEFGVGTCIVVTVPDSIPGSQEAPKPVVQTVACTDPNQGRVIGREDFPKPCPTGSRAVLIPEQKKSLCVVLR